MLNTCKYSKNKCANWKRIMIVLFAWTYIVWLFFDSVCFCWHGWRWRCSAMKACSCAFLCQVDSLVFETREMVQRLAFGLSFLQRMDMKPVVIMGWSEHEDEGAGQPLAGSQPTRGLVERSKQLTVALQQYSVAVLPLFSAESFLFLEETQPGSRWALRTQPWMSRAPVWVLSLQHTSSCNRRKKKKTYVRQQSLGGFGVWFQWEEVETRSTPVQEFTSKTWVWATCFFNMNTHFWSEPHVLLKGFIGRDFGSSLLVPLRHLQRVVGRGTFAGTFLLLVFHSFPVSAFFFVLREWCILIT